MAPSVPISFTYALKEDRKNSECTWIITFYIQNSPVLQSLWHLWYEYCKQNFIRVRWQLLGQKKPSHTPIFYFGCCLSLFSRLIFIDGGKHQILQTLCTYSRDKLALHSSCRDCHVFWIAQNSWAQNLKDWLFILQ